MRKQFVALSVGLSLFCGAAAQAQVAPIAPAAPVSPELAFPGYEPTVFTSRDQVQKVFDEMPWSFKSPTTLFGRDLGGSQCYQRAHIWSYDFARNQNIKAMKAFVFYTHTFKEWHKKHKKKKFDWWFHVTPYVLLKNPETQQIEELTLDATFSDEILPMKPWTDLFVASGRKCAENVPYQKFKCEVEGVGADENNPCEYTVKGTEHCYLVRVPATMFEPDEIEAYHASGRWDFSWNAFAMGKLHESLEKAPLDKSKKDWYRRLGIPMPMKF